MATNGDFPFLSAWAKARSRGYGRTEDLIGQTLGGTNSAPADDALKSWFFDAAASGGPVAGSLSATETASDTFVAVGALLVQCGLAATEGGQDTFAATAGLLIQGSMSATEAGQDVFASEGDLVVGGNLSATESGADTFVAGGQLVISAALAATESSSDAFAAIAKVLIQGALSASESGQDAFSATGQLGAVSPPVELPAQQLGGGIINMRRDPKLREQLEEALERKDGPATPEIPVVEAQEKPKKAVKVAKKSEIAAIARDVQAAQYANTAMADQLATLRDKIKVKQAEDAAKFEAEAEDEAFAVMMLLALAA